MDMQKVEKNRSAFFYKSQRLALERVDQQRTDRRYAAQERSFVGGYTGHGTVQVSGATYPLEESGLTLQIGQRVVVRNVGRPGAAIYVPVPQATEI